jgi:hypothetical protein
MDPCQRVGGGGRQGDDIGPAPRRAVGVVLGIGVGVLDGLDEGALPVAVDDGVRGRDREVAAKTGA